MNKKRLASMFATILSICMIVSFYCAVPIFAAEDNSKKEPDTTTIAPEPVSSGDIQIVGYMTDRNKGVGAVEQITDIRPGDTFDLVVKFMDTRPEVLKMANEYINTGQVDPPVHTPVATLNTGSFTRERDMRQHGGNYPDFKLESTNGKFFDGKVTQPDGTASSTYTGSITYTLRFPVKYTGTGNTFSCTISYEKLNTVPIQTVSLTLNNTIDEATIKTETRGTDFVLKSASYGDTRIKAGENFTLSAVLLSSNGTYNVENVSVAAKLPQQFSMQDGSPQVYVGTVSPNQSFSIALNLQASAIAEDGSYAVTLEIKGLNAKDGTAVTTSVDISVPIEQPERFEVTGITVPDYLVAGDTLGGTGTVKLINKGKGIIYNVSIDVTGDHLKLAEGSEFVGNIAAGTENSADFTLAADTAGEHKGQLVITYENARGEEKKITYDFTVFANEGGGGSLLPPMPPVDPEVTEGGIPWWVWLVVVLVLAGGTVAAVMVVKKQKARKEAEMDDDFDDDDDEYGDFYETFPDKQDKGGSNTPEA